MPRQRAAGPPSARRGHASRTPAGPSSSVPRRSCACSFVAGARLRRPCPPRPPRPRMKSRSHMRQNSSSRGCSPASSRSARPDTDLIPPTSSPWGRAAGRIKDGRAPPFAMACCAVKACGRPSRRCSRRASRSARRAANKRSNRDTARGFRPPFSDSFNREIRQHNHARRKRKNRARDRSRHSAFSLGEFDFTAFP